MDKKTLIKVINKYLSNRQDPNDEQTIKMQYSVVQWLDRRPNKDNKNIERERIRR